MFVLCFHFSVYYVKSEHLAIDQKFHLPGICFEREINVGFKYIKTNGVISTSNVYIKFTKRTVQSKVNPSEHFLIENIPLKSHFIFRDRKTKIYHQIRR